jgi:hypothetical protein
MGRSPRSVGAAGTSQRYNATGFSKSTSSSKGGAFPRPGIRSNDLGARSTSSDATTASPNFLSTGSVPASPLSSRLASPTLAPAALLPSAAALASPPPRAPEQPLVPEQSLAPELVALLERSLVDPREHGLGPLLAGQFLVRELEDLPRLAGAEDALVACGVR